MPAPAARLRPAQGRADGPLVQALRPPAPATDDLHQGPEGPRAALPHRAFCHDLEHHIFDIGAQPSRYLLCNRSPRPAAKTNYLQRKRGTSGAVCLSVLKPDVEGFTGRLYARPAPTVRAPFWPDSPAYPTRAGSAASAGFGLNRYRALLESRYQSCSREIVGYALPLVAWFLAGRGSRPRWISASTVTLQSAQFRATLLTDPYIVPPRCGNSRGRGTGRTTSRREHQATHHDHGSLGSARLG